MVFFLVQRNMFPKMTNSLTISTFLWPLMQNSEVLFGIPRSRLRFYCMIYQKLSYSITLGRLLYTNKIGLTETKRKIHGVSCTSNSKCMAATHCHTEIILGVYLFVGYSATPGATNWFVSNSAHYQLISLKIARTFILYHETMLHTHVNFAGLVVFVY